MTAGAVLISTSGAWVRAADVAPSVSGVYRMAVGGVILLAVCAARGQPIWPAQRAALWFLVPALCFTFDLFFWHKSILMVGPGLAAILANLQVFMLAAVGFLWLGEQLRLRFILGLALAAGGIWLLIGHGLEAGEGQFQLGVWFGLATALAYSLFLLSLRRARNLAPGLSPMATLGLISLACAVLLAGVARAESASFVVGDGRSLLFVVANGVCCQVVGWLLVTRSIAHLPASLVGLILLLEPGLSFVWDVLFFDRPLAPWDLPGLVLVLCGIYVASIGEGKRGR